MDNAAVLAAIAESEAVLHLTNRAIKEVQRDLCEEINRAMVAMLRDMRAARTSSEVGVYRSPYAAFTSFEIEEWTPVGERGYAVDHIASGFSTRECVRPYVEISFRFVLGAGMMADRCDPGSLTIEPRTRTAGSMSVRGFAAGMARVERTLEYEHGWEAALREIGFLAP